MKKKFISITGTNFYSGTKVFKVGQILKLKKEPKNKHDGDAIKVMLKNTGQVGYVANSCHTVAKGTMSASEIHCFFDKKCKCKVRFISGYSIIAEVLIKKTDTIIMIEDGISVKLSQLKRKTI